MKELSWSGSPRERSKGEENGSDPLLKISDLKISGPTVPSSDPSPLFISEMSVCEGRSPRTFLYYAEEEMREEEKRLIRPRLTAWNENRCMS